MKKQMMKFQVLAFTILSCGILISNFEIPKAMPRKLLKGIKLTSMSTSLSTSSSTSISRTSSTLMTQTDGALPQNSNLQTVVSSVQEASGGSDPVVKPKTYASLFPKSSSLASQVSSLQISETDSSSLVSTKTKSTSSVSVTEVTEVVKRKRGSKGAKWGAYPGDLIPGQTIYKPTVRDNVIIDEGGMRPHLVLKIEKTSQNHSVITVAEMSKAKGKGDKPFIGENYLINPKNPDFSGDNSGFVKLDRVRDIIVKNSKLQNLGGRVVDQEDMDRILRITGIKK